NAIIHGYESNSDGVVYISVTLHEDGVVELMIRDEGLGIDNVDEAKQPLYTTKPDLERSGMGFTIMENFMDEIRVESTVLEGTTLYLKKHLTN
ncbi:anti-sigma F factor, partial [Paenarthrobacter aurescens]|nr:anti-sigma F factor [Paenarthrobacter aurescens]